MQNGIFGHAKLMFYSEKLVQTVEFWQGVENAWCWVISRPNHDQFRILELGSP
jgi:hypothetical protein